MSHRHMFEDQPLKRKEAPKGSYKAASETSGEAKLLDVVRAEHCLQNTKKNSVLAGPLQEGIEASLEMLQGTRGINTESTRKRTNPTLSFACFFGVWPR